MANLNGNKKRIILSYSGESDYDLASKYINNTSYDNVVFFQDKYGDIWKNGKLYASYTRSCAYTVDSYNKAISYTKLAYDKLFEYTQSAYNDAIEYTKLSYNNANSYTVNHVIDKLNEYTNSYDAPFLRLADINISGVLADGTETHEAESYYIIESTCEYIFKGKNTTQMNLPTIEVVENTLYDINSSDKENGMYYYFVPKGANKWCKILKSPNVPVSCNTYYTSNIRDWATNNTWNTYEPISTLPTTAGSILEMKYDGVKPFYTYLPVSSTSEALINLNSYLANPVSSLSSTNGTIINKIPYINDHSETLIGETLTFKTDSSTNTKQRTIVKATNKNSSAITLNLPNESGTLLTDNNIGTASSLDVITSDNINNIYTDSSYIPVVTNGNIEIGDVITMHQEDSNLGNVNLVGTITNSSDIYLKTSSDSDYYTYNNGNLIGTIMTDTKVNSITSDLKDELETEINTITANIYNSGVVPEANKLDIADNNTDFASIRLNTYDGPQLSISGQSATTRINRTNKSFVTTNEYNYPIFETSTHEISYYMYGESKFNYNGVIVNDKIISSAEIEDIQNSLIDYEFSIDLNIGNYDNNTKVYITNINVSMYDMVSNKYLGMITPTSDNNNKYSAGYLNVYSSNPAWSTLRVNHTDANGSTGAYPYRLFTENNGNLSLISNSTNKDILYCKINNNDPIGNNILISDANIFTGGGNFIYGDTSNYGIFFEFDSTKCALTNSLHFTLDAKKVNTSDTTEDIFHIDNTHPVRFRLSAEVYICDSVNEITSTTIDPTKIETKYIGEVNSSIKLDKTGLNINSDNLLINNRYVSLYGLSPVVLDVNKKISTDEYTLDSDGLININYPSSSHTNIDLLKKYNYFIITNTNGSDGSANPPKVKLGDGLYDRQTIRIKFAVDKEQMRGNSYMFVNKVLTFHNLNDGGARIFYNTTESSEIKLRFTDSNDGYFESASNFWFMWLADKQYWIELPPSEGFIFDKSNSQI